ncbi:hypothetical protein HDU91_000830, partial [Kappamyces sp. JEL0680]
LITTLACPGQALETVPKPLNVGIHGKYLVYALQSGKYHVYDLERGEALHELDIKGVEATRIDGEAHEWEQAEQLLDSHELEVSTFLVGPRVDALDSLRLEGTSTVSMHSPSPVEPHSANPGNHSTNPGSGSNPERPANATLTEQQFEALFTDLNNPAGPFDDHFNFNLQNQQLANEISQVPKTLALNSHVLLTNGPTPDTFLLWDYRNGKLIRKLSEQDAALRKSGVFPLDRTEDLKLAELSRDSSLIYCTIDDDSRRFLVWDFDESGTRDLVCVPVLLEVGTGEHEDDEDMEMEVWVVGTPV